MSATRFRTFLACAPGLETTLCTEINRISSLIPSVAPSATSHVAAAVQHVSKPRIETGGIELWLSPVALWTVCNFARCAESIRVRLGQPVKSTDFRSFRASAARLPLPAFYATGAAINAHVKATALKSKLIHTGALEERVFAALEAKYNVLNAPTEYEFEERATNHDKPASKDSKTTAAKPNTKKPQVVKTSTRPPVGVSISVRVERDWCEFSLDAVSGQGGELHRRGYRPMVTERSLRETLAASILQAIIPSSNVQGVATNNNEEVVLWDPMCGTGILPIEAAMLMHNISVIPPPKQLSKQFAFQDWLSFDAKAYERCLQSAASQANQSVKNNVQWKFVGSDILPKSIKAAQSNWSTATPFFRDSTQSSLCRFEVADFFSPDCDKLVSQNALIVTHLPYEVAGPGDATFTFYRRFGQALQRRNRANLMQWPDSLLRQSFLQKQNSTKPATQPEGLKSGSNVDVSDASKKSDTSNKLVKSPSSPSDLLLAGKPVFVVVADGALLQKATSSQCQWREVLAFNNRGTRCRLMQVQSML